MSDSLEGLTSLLEEFRSLPDHTPAADNQPLGPSAAKELSLVSQSAVEHSHTASLDLPFLLSQEELGLTSDHTDVQLPFEHIQCEGQSLTCLATELIAAQTSQADELQRRKERLGYLQAQLSKQREIKLSTEKELCKIAKAICLSRDECISLTEDCGSLEKSISHLVTAKNDAQLQLSRVKDAAERGEKLYKTYRDKMSRHVARRNELESSLPLYKEVEELQSSIRSLKDQRCRYMQGEGLQVLNGEKQRALQEAIDSALASLVKLEEESKEKRKTIKALREHSQQVQREIEVKRKRHTAQLTRLQRQVSEAQLRKRQWEKEVKQLQESIRELRQRLGQS